MEGEIRLKAVSYHDEAIWELIHAKDLSDEPEAFDRDVFGVLELLKSGQVRPSRIGRSIARQWIFERLPYSLIYVDSEESIRIIAFAHNKRKPGYWRKRLRS